MRGAEFFVRSLNGENATGGCQQTRRGTSARGHKKFYNPKGETKGIKHRKPPGTAVEKKIFTGRETR